MPTSNETIFATLTDVAYYTAAVLLPIAATVVLAQSRLGLCIKLRL